MDGLELNAQREHKADGWKNGHEGISDRCM